MLIPLPIPHPVCIAIELHNRDSDDPISLDSDICWEILKAIEESNGQLQVRFKHQLAVICRRNWGAN